MNTQLAAKGDTFDKGDRFAMDVDKGKTSKGRWWLGTITSVNGTDVRVRHDDDGTLGTYPMSRFRSAACVKLPKTTKKVVIDGYLTSAQVKKLQAAGATPAAKPAVKAPAKPAVKAPAPVKESVPEYIARYSEAMKHRYTPAKALAACVPATEADYKADPVLGYVFNTGRASSTTAQAVPVGFADFKGKWCLVSITVKSQSLLYYPIDKYGHPEWMAQQAADRIKKAGTKQRHSFASFKQLNAQAAGLTNDLTERQADAVNKDTAARDQFFEEFWRKGGRCEAYIKFSNGTQWQTVVEIKFDKGVGIYGSGHKLRWIPWRFVLDMQDRDPTKGIAQRRAPIRRSWWDYL